MAEIAVSTLIQQIDNHIQGNRAARALPICMHILHYFPKHLETYSMMAQALVGQGNLDGALDVYRRVLSADPENLAAYAGLAQVFDHRHRLEEAVWHMERAFELTPTQPHIRKELMRLYAQSELEPRARLKLTRGALARLYVMEGLYDQAIHEFRDIGSTSLSRYDIRVALAETLWRAGRTRDAADVAQSLLDSLPYCLKANLILGTAWNESTISESQKYLERAVSLDPSNQVALKTLGPRSPLRIASVTVPEYVEGVLPRPRAIETRESPPPSGRVEEDDLLVLFDTRETTPALEPHSEKIKTETEAMDEPVGQPIAEVAEAEAIVEPDVQPIAQAAESETQGIIETPQEMVVEEPKGAPDSASTYTAQEIKPSVANADLPPWLESEDESLTESARGELPAAESVSSGGTPSPEWYAQLRRSFSEDPEEEQGVSAELIPVPGVNEPEPIATPPLSAATELVQVEPSIETRAGTWEEDVPDWLRDKAASLAEKKQADKTPAPVSYVTESLAESSEEMIPAWLKSQADPVVETREEEEMAPAETVTESQIEPAAETVPSWLSAPAEEEKKYEELPERLKQPTLTRAEIYRAIELLPALTPVEKTETTQSERSETLAETTETRVPKWVQVLSQREPEKTNVAEESFARLEPAAPAAPVAEPPTPSAGSETPPTDFRQAEPKRIYISSEPAPPAAEYPEPETAAAPSFARSTQAAEPEPPSVVELATSSVPAPSPPQPNRQPKYYSRLAQARASHYAVRISDALADYDFLIQKAPRLINEVIIDLEVMVATGDAPLDAHRLLGDAYTRVGRLNDALQRYRYIKRTAESHQ